MSRGNFQNIVFFNTLSAYVYFAVTVVLLPLVTRV